MNKDNFSDLGKEFKDKIKNSIYTGDFKNINKDVGSTVNSALDMAFEEVRKAIGAIQIDNQLFKNKTTLNQQKTKNQQTMNQQTMNQQSMQQKAMNQQSANQQAVNQQTMDQQHINPQAMTRQAKQYPTKYAVNFPHAPIGKVAGTLYTVFGSIGIGLSGTALVILASMGYLINGALTLTPILGGLLIALGAGVVMEERGSTIRNRLKRFRQYLGLLYGRNSCTIKEFSTYTGRTERFIVKDFKKMIAIGMFPQAHIDEMKTIVMFNRDSYEQYLSYQAEQKARMLEEQENAKELKKAKGAKVNENLEVNSVIEEGKLYIRQINEAKSAIGDQEVFNKVHRMEEIISKIIEYVEGHPEKLPEVRRFMEYYLPTTIKLLNAYMEFDRQPIQGDNIRTAKGEIKDALDTINFAFENLLDILFENAAWDVSADISVLHSMLAQEGLTEKDFKKNK